MYIPYLVNLYQSQMLKTATDPSDKTLLTDGSWYCCHRCECVLPNIQESSQDCPAIWITVMIVHNKQPIVPLQPSK